MKTIKNLIVSGCSFTANPNSWATVLAKHYDLNLINLAKDGAGNRHIANSIILYLEQNSINLDDTLIIFMWSGLYRRDWIKDFNIKYEYLNTVNYRYTKTTSLAMPYDMLKNSKLGVSKNTSQFEIDLLDVAYGDNFDSRILDSWLAINHLNCYLKNNGYRYYQTNFFNPTIDLNGCTFKGTNYKILDNVNVPFNFDNFIDFVDDEYLGNYAVKNNLILSKLDWHPTKVGYQKWTEELLIKKLILNLGCSG